MKDMPTQFRKGDLLAILLVIVLAFAVACFYIPGEDGQDRFVQVYQDGKLIERVCLEENTQIRVQGKYINLITVYDGKVSVTESDCPGEDCVHTGAIADTSRSIVCLPNGVEIRIEGAVADVDFVVG